MIEDKAECRNNSRELIKALSVESRLSIYLYLSIYNELTLEDFSKYMKKSKSTMHHHIQEMLNSKILVEHTKPGSKTRYYKLADFNLRDEFLNTFGVNSFKGLNTEKQIQLLRDFVDYSTSQNKIMQYLLQLIISNEELIYQRAVDKKKDPLESRLDLVSHFIGRYNGTAEEAEEFKMEMLDLLEKYTSRESQNKDTDKPFTFLVLGMNIDDVLKRKYTED